jgi:hypothetical protein
MISAGARARRLAAAIGFVAFIPLLVPGKILAQTAASVAAARELAQALDAAKLDSIAAPDPSEQGRFVAALYFPGAQLLVVSARYAVPPLLLDKMNSKNYRDIYIDLNAASVAGTKVFVIDQNADGLAVRPGDQQAPDMYENGEKQISFDGEWRKAKMTEQDYMKAFATADQRYTQILNLLAAQAKSAGS